MRESVCARPNRAGAVEMAGSCESGQGVYRPLPDSRFFLRQRGRECERVGREGEKTTEAAGERAAGEGKVEEARRR